MLLDLVAVLAGFVGIILLLSLAVTAIVELLQAALMLRYRILSEGIQAMFEMVGEQKDLRAVIKRHDKLIPRATLDRADLPALAAIFEYEDGKDENGEIDPAVAQRLADRIKRRVENLERLFPLMEERTSEKFKARIRLLTLVIAVIVAFVMQANSLELLHKLSKDPVYREAALSIAEGLAQTDERYTLEARDYSEEAAAALETLTERHPELRPVFEQASGAGEDPDFIIRELDLLLEESASERRGEIVSEYRALIESGAEARFDAALRQLNDVEQQLSTLGIRPWHAGWGFYASFSNWIGMLFTAVLLSLGAPFWFDTLQKLLGILQSFRSGSPPPSGATQQPAQPTTT